VNGLLVVCLELIPVLLLQQFPTTVSTR
jgi:hypothetical protein